MAKSPNRSGKRRLAEPPEAPPYNAIDDEALPGESLDDYMQRKDAEEGRKHDANESRHAPKFSETWDPHMGDL